MITFKIWDAGDWIELWADGVCLSRGHTLSRHDVENLLSYLGFQIAIERVPGEAED